MVLLSDWLPGSLLGADWRPLTIGLLLSRLGSARLQVMDRSERVSELLGIKSSSCFPQLNQIHNAISGDDSRRRIADPISALGLLSALLDQAAITVSVRGPRTRRVYSRMWSVSV